jgi:hypothetical protein
VLRAYYPNGTLKWSTDVQGNVYGTVPAVSADGTIYVSAGGSLVAVNPDGSEKWRKQLSNEQSVPHPLSVRTIESMLVPPYSDYGYLHAFGLGPLRADAGGPYSGLASHTPAQFPRVLPSADNHPIPITGSSETETPLMSWNPVISTGTSAPTMSPSQSPTTTATQQRHDHSNHHLWSTDHLVHQTNPCPVHRQHKNTSPVRTKILCNCHRTDHRPSGRFTPAP